MKIFTRYLLRAHLGPFLFAFGALTGVVLINTLVRRLADLAGKGLPTRVILEFFVLALPATVALTFPMAVLVSVLYTWSQLTSENEVTALKASGVDLKRLLLPLLVVAVALAGTMVWFNDRVLPEANFRWSQLFLDIARKTPTLSLAPQTVNRIQPGSGSATYYLKAARLDPATNRMWDVVIFDMSNPSLSRTIFADSGRTSLNAAQTDMVIRLYDGHIRELRYDAPQEFTRIEFEQQWFGIPGVGTVLDVTRDGAGHRGDREMTIAMLRERVDTLAAERVGVLKAMGEAALREVDHMVTGSLPEVGSAALALDGTPRERARRTVEEMESYQRRLEDLDRQVREMQVEIHKKYSIAFASLVFVVVGAPLALRFGGGGIGMTIATSLVIFALYYVGLIGGESLADRGVVSPVVAMWVMNAAMTVVGVVGLLAMGRETATARSGPLDALRQALRDALATLRPGRRRPAAAAGEAGA